MAFLTRAQRLTAVICISFSFFIAEITVGFYTQSLALIADAFHYLNDLIGFIVALVAVKIQENGQSPQTFSFGWQRAQLLSAFFNGIFLLALGLSILIQAIERFIHIQQIENPKLILIIGCVGLALNLLSVFFLHEHDHNHGHSCSKDVETADVDSILHSRIQVRFPAFGQSMNETPGSHKVSVKNRDLGMLGVLVHVAGDAFNNICVIIAALIIWRSKSPNRFYADPSAGLATALMIIATSLPLVRNSGTILLESAPLGINLSDIKHDIEQLPGILSVHELHVWRLNQDKTLATAHILTSDPSLDSFMRSATIIGECLHAYGIHSLTLQPELPKRSEGGRVKRGGEGLLVEESQNQDQNQNQGRSVEQEKRIRRQREVRHTAEDGVGMCGLRCRKECVELTCCG